MRKTTSLKIITHNFKGLPLYLLMDMVNKRRSLNCNRLNWYDTSLGITVILGTSTSPFLNSQLIQRKINKKSTHGTSRKHNQTPCGKYTYHNHRRDEEALDTGALITDALPCLTLLQEIREQPSRQPRKTPYKYAHNVHVIHHVMIAL
jgi:hypothetical protein